MRTRRGNTACHAAHGVLRKGALPGRKHRAHLHRQKQPPPVKPPFELLVREGGEASQLTERREEKRGAWRHCRMVGGEAQRSGRAGHAKCSADVSESKDRIRRCIVSMVAGLGGLLLREE